MTLPALPNALSYSQINTELGRANDTSLSLSDPYLKTMFSDWTNPISMSNGRGKAWPLIHPSVPNVNLFYSGTGEGNITVPAGATRVSIKAWGGGGGAGGGGAGSTVSGAGGSGAFFWGIYAVTPGETLSYLTGRGGVGGTGGTGAGEGGGGGGATWLKNISQPGEPYFFIVAGGGGGGGVGGQSNDHGGPGGGGGVSGLAGYNNGSAGSSGPGLVGGTTAGGTGGSAGGGTGDFIQGGTAVSGAGGTSPTSFGGNGGGGDGGDNYQSGGGGGGGGSGWYGGGAGGFVTNQGGGGGGGGSIYYQGYLLQQIYLYNGRTGTVGTQSTWVAPLYQDANLPTFLGSGGGGVSGSSVNGNSGTTGVISLQFFTT